MDVFQVLSLRGTKKILDALRDKNRMRYSDLVEVVGFSTTTSRALKAMQLLKLIDKEVLNEPYRPVAYSLTERGRRLSEIVADLERF